MDASQDNKALIVSKIISCTKRTVADITTRTALLRGISWQNATSDVLWRYKSKDDRGKRNGCIISILIFNANYISLSARTMS